jgi:hypothetical protein
MDGFESSQVYHCPASPGEMANRPALRCDEWKAGKLSQVVFHTFHIGLPLSRPIPVQALPCTSCVLRFEGDNAYLKDIFNSSRCNGQNLLGTHQQISLNEHYQ